MGTDLTESERQARKAGRSHKKEIGIQITSHANNKAF